MVSRRVSAGALALVLLTGCSGGSNPGERAAPSPSPTAGSATPSPRDPGTTRSQTPRATTRGSPTFRGDALEMPAVVSPTEVSLADLLPPRRARPLLIRPIPGAAHARGRLVADFPGYLRPVRGSVILGSSLSPARIRLQVALDAVTDLSAEAVLREYRRRLTRLHMREGDAASAGASDVMTMQRGGSSLVVTVTPEAGRTSYTVFGTLHAGT